MAFKVEVKDIPIRYENTTFGSGKQFVMAKEHVKGVESLIKVIEEVAIESKSIDEMTITELKDYATENEIDLGDAKKKDEILAVIQSLDVEKEEETPEE